MRKLGVACAFAGLVAANQAIAGGLDRSMQRIAPLFEPGGYAEASLGLFFPTLSGSALGANSGNIAENYTQFGAAFKQDVGANTSVAIIFDQPYGADIAYPTGTGYVFEATTATFSSAALTGILQYNFDGGFSLYGGARAQTIDADAAIPAIQNYVASADQDNGFGYLIGASYEREDIALRVALTYFSSIDHGGSATEFSAVTGTTTTPLDIETPQAVNFEFQTGVAADTLLFGGVRWVNWEDFVIAPEIYSTVLVGQPLVSYNGNTFTYTLGVGRRFTDTWSGSFELIYEPPVGGFQSNLGPKDAFYGATLGAQYTKDNFKISGGINWTQLEDTETIVNMNPLLTSSFTGNSSIGVGVRVGYYF